MGGRVETIIHKAIEALERRNSTLAAEVFTEDQIIDRLEVEIEERCVNLLALQQPTAASACSRSSSRSPATCASSPRRSRSRTTWSVWAITP